LGTPGIVTAIGQRDITRPGQEDKPDTAQIMVPGVCLCRLSRQTEQRRVPKAVPFSTIDPSISL
jgi:hypothetical protein